MNNLLSFDDLGDIRKTDDGKVSVYDLISVVGGKKDPVNTFKRLQESYPDTMLKCQSVKLTRKDGKKGNLPSPVADKQTTLEILGLLPGTVGKTYREAAAKLMLEFLEAPETLALRAIDRITDDAKLTKIVERAEGKKVRNAFTDELKARGVSEGVGYAQVTNAGYKGLFGATSQELKEEKGLTKSQSLRDGMSSIELAAVRLTELLAMEKMSQVDAQGTKQAKHCTFQAGSNIGKAIELNRTEDVPVYQF